ncbi:MAG TPA: DUF4402 domain-containing protein [Longimicrobium sp.]|jgi:hypothetical protein|uniref:DUF4402 domain-containing protein n=1 Tax=Longimicrobium sp. TaxID=2029185 RepID=UPI002EDB4E60
MRARRLLPLLAAVLALAGLHAPAHAQARRTDDGTLPVSLTILFPPLLTVGVRPLQFGTVIPGAGAVTVLPNTPRSGEWRLSGIRNRKSIDISFTLPTVLTNAQGRTMPISFNGNYAATCEIDTVTNGCEAGTYMAWNPVTTPSMRDFPERAKPGRPKFTTTDYKVFIGGQVTPPANAAAGKYTGTVTITVVVN